MVDITGDGNCLYRALSRFIFGTESLHNRIRNEIYQEALNRAANYPDITLNTERGPMRIRDYINLINTEGFYGGELDLSIACSIYNINIATFREIYDNNNNLQGLSFINYYNNDGQENRHLLILTNIDNSHFRIGYANNNIINHNELEYKLNLELINKDDKNILKSCDNNENEIIIKKRSFGYFK